LECPRGWPNPDDRPWYANTIPPVAPWILNAPTPPVNEYKWELYHLAEDYSQANDLAAKMPDKLKQLLGPLGGISDRADSSDGETAETLKCRAVASRRMGRIAPLWPPWQGPKLRPKRVMCLSMYLSL
jgi:hypothetical protein